MFFTYASLQKSRHWDCRILSFSSSLHKHRGSCRVSSFYIYSSGTFPAGKRLQETRRAEKCQQFARPWQQENEDNQTLAPASAGLAVRCRMPYLNSDCNSWATSATFTWLYSATVLHSSVCPKHRLHSAMSAMSRPCLVHVLPGCCFCRSAKVCSSPSGSLPLARKGSVLWHCMERVFQCLSDITNTYKHLLVHRTLYIYIIHIYVYTQNTYKFQ